jgi:hypothetical protein
MVCRSDSMRFLKVCYTLKMIQFLEYDFEQSPSTLAAEVADMFETLVTFY